MLRLPCLNRPTSAMHAAAWTVWAVGLWALGVLGAPGAIAQQLAFDGEVVALDPVVVELAEPAAVPLGSVVYTLRPVAVGLRGIAVLTGTFAALRSAEGRVAVIPQPDERATSSEPPSVRLGDAVQIDTARTAGRITIQSEPGDVSARVLWRGATIGTAPFAITVVPGSHRFEVHADGREIEEQTLTVAPGDEQTVMFSLRERPPATWFYDKARRLFNSNDFTESLAHLDRALNALVPLPEADRSGALFFRDTVAGARDLADRMRDRRFADQEVREATAYYRSIRKNERDNNEPALRQALTRLLLLLPDDPLVTALSREYPAEAR